MCERKGDLASKEFETAKEILIPNFNILIISGDSGTGKSTLGRGLAKLLGIKIADVGDLIREETKKQTGTSPVGFADRDVSVDTQFDTATAKIVRNAASSEPQVLVARMGPWVAKKEEVAAREAGEDFPIVVSINLSASPEAKKERIRIRERVKHPEMSDEEIDQKTQSGNDKNQKNWHEAHPDLEGDPLDPQAKYQGEYIFTFAINTDNLDADEVLQKAIKLLRETRYLVKPGVVDDVCNRKSA